METEPSNSQIHWDSVDRHMHQLISRLVKSGTIYSTDEDGTKTKGS